MKPNSRFHWVFHFFISLEMAFDLVMAFYLASLGFLTPFQFDHFQEQVTNVAERHAALTLRNRLRCIIVRKNQEEPAESVCEKNFHTQRALEFDVTNNGVSSTQKSTTNEPVNFHFDLIR